MLLLILCDEKSGREMFRVRFARGKREHWHASAEKRRWGRGRESASYRAMRREGKKSAKRIIEQGEELSSTRPPEGGEVGSAAVVNLSLREG